MYFRLACTVPLTSTNTSLRELSTVDWKSQMEKSWTLGSWRHLLVKVRDRQSWEVPFLNLSTQSCFIHSFPNTFTIINSVVKSSTSQGDNWQSTRIFIENHRDMCSIWCRGEFGKHLLRHRGHTLYGQKYMYSRKWQPHSQTIGINLRLLTRTVTLCNGAVNVTELLLTSLTTNARNKAFQLMSDSSLAYLMQCLRPPESVTVVYVSLQTEQDCRLTVINQSHPPVKRLHFLFLT